MTDKDKLERMKKLADAMYTTAQYLTTYDSGLRKATDEYYKFIIYEYNKQEPTSEDLEKDIVEYKRLSPEYNLQKVDKSSEDLDKVFKQYAEENHCDTTIETSDGGMDYNNFDEIYDACVYGAKMQKERDQKELQIAEEHGILTGMNMEREKMMKDAVEGELDCDDNGSWCSFDSNIVPISQAGNKVKVIIIKE